jgi:cellulose synthase (UDP-forming)
MKLLSPAIRSAKDLVADATGRKPYRRYREKADRARRLDAQFLSIFSVVSTVVYLVWLATRLNPAARWLTIPFFFSEVAALLVFIAFAFVCWYPRYHRPRGLERAPVDKPLTVDVFVTVCGEPFELVAETIRAAVAIDYPVKTVHVLDDKADPKLRALAAELGIKYLARPAHDDAKAGNLNYGFERTAGDLILTLDADQVPSPDILKSLVGYFTIPRVAFVQTMQAFKVPQGDPFCNTDPIFYTIMQPGKDTDNVAFSCGSGVVYRREALEDIGGFSTWNIVEDLHTSLSLHDKGWRSIYHDTPLSIGTTPNDIWSVYKQRYQWAADSLRIFFWDNPFRRRGLSWRQRFQYAHTGMVYLFGGFVMPVFYILPTVSLFTGQFVIDTEWWRYLAFRLPSFIFTTLAYRKFIPVDHYVRASNTWLAYFPAYVYGAYVALRSRKKKPEYRVNRKTWDLASTTSQLLGILPQLVLITASVLAIPYGFLRQTGKLDLLLISTLWALGTIDTLRWLPLAALHSRKSAPARDVLWEPRTAAASLEEGGGSNASLVPAGRIAASPAVDRRVRFR